MWSSRFRRFENLLNNLILLLLALLPLAEILLRELFSSGIPSVFSYVYHLVLLLTFLGGALTAREESHLAISAGAQLLPPSWKRRSGVINGHLAVAVITAVMWSSVSFLFLAFDSGMRVGFIPQRLFIAVMPVSFLLIAVRFAVKSPRGVGSKLFVLLGFVTGTLLAYQSVYNLVFIIDPMYPPLYDRLMDLWSTALPPLMLPLLAVLVVSAFFGNPIFVVLGGAAYLLFIRSGGALESVPNEAYTMLISETIPVIPLFTLAGFILSESNAGERLVRLFRGLFGWVPGGEIIAAVLVSTFFTTFTGASGVTILALGGVLYVVLHKEGHFGDDFTSGFLTAAGSVGFLFPPSLPIILYAVVAQISVVDMFVGGFVPGIIVMGAMMAIGVYVASRNKVPKVPFRGREIVLGLKQCLGELLLPVFIILFYFGGVMTLLETSAFAVVYVFIVEVFIYREVKIRQMPSIGLKALPIIGGVLVILAMSRGLSYYFIDANVPVMLTEWIEGHISSKFVFLILLNLALIITGCFMDIFSAIMVVAPLVIPVGEIFGIHPVHLGIIFLANLELGFMTPPVGLNLFLASYRFDKPLTRIYRNVVPFFLLQFGAVLVITYVPQFTTFLLEIAGG
jgi:tripartite ATP-independent transporter DctM subunit